MEKVGRYTLGVEVARGASGAVHRAVDPAGRQVALKLLHPWRAADARHRRRFEVEVQALLRVRHESVVALLDAGEHQGTPWLVMEWVEGESLGERLVREGPLPPRAAAEVVERLARALEVSHAQGVLHRDIKPGNVLLRAGPALEPLLSDFGLARDVTLGASIKTAEGQALGTPGFWAPEQARGDQEAVGPASDVYGLGALLYACLTGHPPQAGANLAEILAAAQRLPAPPSRLVAEIPARLDAICLRCLEPEPAARWPSTRALADALRAFLDGQEPPARGRARVLVAALGAGALVVWLLALGLRPAPGHDAPPVTGASPVSSSATARPSRPDTQEVLDRAAALLEARDYPGAFHELDQAVALDPGRADVWAARSRSHVRVGNIPAALPDIERALQLAPDRSDLLLERAEVRLHLHMPEEALEDLDKVLAAKPEQARALADRGQAHDMMGDAERAHADIAKALKLDPLDDRALRVRSVLRGREGDCKGALADLDRAIQLAPERLEYLCDRAELKASTGDREGAERDFSQALASHPDYVAALVGRGSFRQRTGDQDGALTDLERALELDPGEPMAHIGRAGIREARGDLVGARADYDAAIETMPWMGLPWHRRGVLRMDMGDMDGARADLDHALQLAPDHPWILLDRALVREEAGDMPGARVDVDRSLAVFPDNSDALYHRGRMRKETGDPAGALQDLEKALKIDPEAPFAKQVQELIDELHGKPPPAEKDPVAPHE